MAGLARITFDVLILVGKVLQNVINERARSIHTKGVGVWSGGGGVVAWAQIPP